MNSSLGIFNSLPYPKDEVRLECGDMGTVAFDFDQLTGHLRPIPQKLTSLVLPNDPVWIGKTATVPLLQKCQRNCDRMPLWTPRDLRTHMRLSNLVEKWDISQISIAKLQRMASMANDPSAINSLGPKDVPPVASHLFKILDVNVRKTENHLGNCMSAIPTINGQFIAVYPCGQAHNHLNLAKMSFDDDRFNVIRSADLLLDESILQTDAVAPDDHCFGPTTMLFRTNSRVELITLEDSFSSGAIVGSTLSKGSIDVHINRLMTDDIWTVDEKGNFQAFAIDNPGRPEQTETFPLEENYVAMASTEHPRLVAICNRQLLRYYDLRISSSAVEMLRIEETDGEGKLVGIKCVTDHTNQLLVAGMKSLFVMDQRFPRTPMIRWNHMMFAPPTFLTDFVADRSGLNGFALGSRELGEVQLLSGLFRSNSGCFTGSKPPTQLSTPEEIHCWSRAKRPQLLGNRNFHTRLLAPLRGLTSVAIGPNDFAVIQLRDTGDLFYQILTEDVVENESNIDLLGGCLVEDWGKFVDTEAESVRQYRRPLDPAEFHPPCLKPIRIDQTEAMRLRQSDTAVRLQFQTRCAKALEKFSRAVINQSFTSNDLPMTSAVTLKPQLVSSREELETNSRGSSGVNPDPLIWDCWHQPLD